MTVDILFALAPVVITVVGITWIVRSLLRARRLRDPYDDARWYLHPFISVADAIRQLLLVLGAGLAPVAALALFRRFGWSADADWFVLAGSALAVALAYWQRAPLALVAAALGALGWWTALSLRWAESGSGSSAAAIAGLAALAVTLYASGRIHEIDERFRRFGFFLWIVGTSALLGMLLWLSSQEGLLSVGGYSQTEHFTTVQVLAISGVWLVALAAASLAIWRKTLPFNEAIPLIVVGALMAAFALFKPSGIGSRSYVAAPELSTLGAVWALALNVVLLAALVGMVFLGYERREEWLVTFGALMLFVFVLVKYFDWLFTFLDRSIAFVIAGALLLGVGWSMERARRMVLAAMETTDEHA